MGSGEKIFHLKWLGGNIQRRWKTQSRRRVTLEDDGRLKTLMSRHAIAGRWKLRSKQVMTFEKLGLLPACSILLAYWAANTFTLPALVTPIICWHVLNSLENRELHGRAIQG